MPKTKYDYEDLKQNIRSSLSYYLMRDNYVIFDISICSSRDEIIFCFSGHALVDGKEVTSKEKAFTIAKEAIMQMFPNDQLPSFWIGQELNNLGTIVALEYNSDYAGKKPWTAVVAPVQCLIKLEA